MWIVDELDSYRATFRLATREGGTGSRRRAIKSTNRPTNRDRQRQTGPQGTKNRRRRREARLRNHDPTYRSNSQHVRWCHCHEGTEISGPAVIIDASGNAIQQRPHISATVCVALLKLHCSARTHARNYLGSLYSGYWWDQQIIFCTRG